LLLLSLAQVLLGSFLAAFLPCCLACVWWISGCQFTGWLVVAGTDTDKDFYKVWTPVLQASFSSRSNLSCFLPHIYCQLQHPGMVGSQLACFRQPGAELTTTTTEKSNLAF
jgi:hypothetical protein